MDYDHRWPMMVVESVVSAVNSFVSALGWNIYLFALVLLYLLGTLLKKWFVDWVGSRFVDSLFDKIWYQYVYPQCILMRAKLTGLSESDRKMKQAKKMLRNWYDVRGDGSIELKIPSEAGSQSVNLRKPPLYVFAARAAYEEDKRETPKVTGQEIEQEVGSADIEHLLHGEKILAEKGESGQEEYELNREKADEVATFIRYLDTVDSSSAQLFSTHYMSKKE